MCGTECMRSGGVILKLNISLDDDLLRRIDEQADNTYMTRSGLISQACVQYLGQLEMMNLLKDMGACMRKIAESGNIDDESMQLLRDFEGMCRVIKKAE